MDENRKKALAAALGQIEKQFGKGSVMRLGDGTGIRDIETVSTGSIGRDGALGIGGSETADRQVVGRGATGGEEHFFRRAFN